MSLGVLSFLVGTQIGAQQKSKYLSAIEEQKRQEAAQLQAKKDFKTFEIEEETTAFKEKELWKATELENEKIANQIMMYPLTEQLEFLKAVTTDQKQIDNIVRLAETKLKMLEAEEKLKNKLALEQYEAMTPLTIKRQVGEYKALTDPTVEREGELLDQSLKKQHADDLLKLTDPEFVNATIDNKVKTIKATGIAQGRVDVLNKISEHANTELQDLINDVAANRITSDTAAQGQADTVALIEKLSNKELEALQLLNSSNKIISDSKATSTARIAALKDELGDEELQKLLLDAKKDELTQSYTLKLEDDMLRLTNEDYQALLNSTKARQILSEQAATDQAMLNTLNNKELQDKLISTKRAQQLSEGETELVLELKKLKDTEFQDLLLKLGLDEYRAKAIINNVAALDLHEGKALIDKELAKTQKAIEEAANIGSKVSYEIVDRHGKSQKKEIPWLLSYAKNQIKVKQGTEENEMYYKVKYIENLVGTGQWEELMKYGTPDDALDAQKELESALEIYLFSSQRENTFGVTHKKLHAEFHGLLRSPIARETMNAVTEGRQVKMESVWKAANSSSDNETVTVKYDVGEDIHMIFSKQTPKRKQTFENIVNFRLNNGLTTQAKLDGGEALSYLNNKTLAFFEALEAPNKDFKNGLGKAAYSALRSVDLWNPDKVGMSSQIKNKMLEAGRAAGLVSAEEWIQVLAIGVHQGQNLSANVKQNVAGKLKEMEALGVNIENVRSKHNASTMLQRAIVSLASEYVQDEIDQAIAGDAELMYYFDKNSPTALTASKNATQLTGAGLSSVVLITSKLPHAVKSVLEKFGVQYGMSVDEETGEQIVNVKSGTEEGVFRGFGEAYSKRADNSFSALNMNNDAHKRLMQDELERIRKVNPQQIANLAKELGKDMKDVTYLDYYKAEGEARERNLETYNGYLNTYLNDSNADARAEAKRDLLRFVIAYQYASLLQGGTGGRTISDQDVENMLKALKAGALDTPAGTLTAIMEVYKQSKFSQHVTSAYLSGDNGLIAAAHTFESQFAPDVNFVYDSQSAPANIGNKVLDMNGNVLSPEGDTETNLFRVGPAGKIEKLEPVENLFDDFIAGKKIKITQEFMDVYGEKYPEFRAQYSVGQMISIGAGT